jgi:K+ transporter
MMNEVLKMRKFELISVFWLTDFKTCVDTALFEVLLKTSSPKHTTVLAVAKAVVDNPDFIDTHGSDIEKMILETMRVIMRSGYGDRRVLNAVGYLAGKLFEDNQTAKNMATLLCWSTNA